MKIGWQSILWILMAVGLTASMVLVTLDSYTDFQKKRMLQRKGITVSGKVIAKYIDKDLRNTSYHHLKTFYEYNKLAKEVDIWVHRRLYRKYEMGDEVALHFLQENPSTIDFVENKQMISYFYWLLGGTLFFVLFMFGLLYFQFFKS